MEVVTKLPGVAVNSEVWMVNVPGEERCRNCKHWRADADGDGWGICERTWCSNGKPEDKNSLAHAYDGDSYYGMLECRPEFGCVQYEVKDATTT